MEKKKRPRWQKILFWILGIVVGIILIIAAAGYFYGGSLIKGTIIDAVKKESKGLYRAEIDKLYFNVWGGDLYIRDFSIIPDTVRLKELKAADSVPGMLIQLHLNRLNIYNLHLKKVIFNKQVDVRKILVRSPDLMIWKMQKAVKDTTSEDFDPTTTKKEISQSIPLPKGWKSINIEKISLEKGSLAYFNRTSDSIQKYAIPSFDIRIENLYIDSTWKTDPRIYNTDDIRVILRDIRQETGNGMYAINLGELGLSTEDELVYVKNFYLEPLYNYHDFSRKLGFQTDRMDIHVGAVTLAGIDWRELLFHQRLIAEKLQIDSMLMDDFRDKRVPVKPGFKPPMPQELLRNLKMYLRIDTLEMTNGKATYNEQVGSKPGYVFFDRINGTLAGLTNDSVWLAERKVSTLNAEAYLYGTGKLQASIDFIFGDPMNRFSISSALLTSFNLPEVNAMLTKQLPARIDSGYVSKMVVHGIQFNDNYSTGSLTLYYDNLIFKLLNEEHTAWSGIKTGFLNWVAGDFVISKRNPTHKGKLHSGIVYFQRDKHKSIINFVWKSAFSGLKSNAGINTKEQKEIKKEQKETKKEEKPRRRKKQ